MRQRAQADILAAKTAAVNDIYAQTAQLATQVAGRILRREINVQDQQALVEQSLRELTNVKQN